MRIQIICPNCSTDGYARFHMRAFQDNGLYEGICPQGHEILVATQTLRHEMLFEIALNAISDGYYREAIASFAAAVERYYEFAIRVFSLQAQVPQSVFVDAWKAIGGQSERQAGAYIFLFATIFREPPKVLPNKQVELRNKVVHKGYLPIQSEVISFGKVAHEIIQDGVRLLRDGYLTSVSSVLAQEQSGAIEAMGTRYPRSFMVTPTALNVIENISSGHKPFEDLLIERNIVPV